MADQGGDAVTGMEATTKNIDIDLENVSTYSSRYFHGYIVNGALDCQRIAEYVPRRMSGEVGEPEVYCGLKF